MKPSQLIISVLVVLVVLSITIGIATVVESNKATGLRTSDGGPLEAADADGPKPKVFVEETMHSFGTMGVGKTRSHIFIVKNEGDAPLKLQKGSSTCKCTVADLENEELKPGDSVEIELEWKPTDADSHFLQTATIHTNDPAMREISLSISGAVEANVRAFPSEEWNFGDIDVTAKKISIVTRIVSRNTKFDLVDFTASVPRTKCTWTPMSEDELKELEATHGYHVTTEVTGPIPIGSLGGELTLHTKGPTAADEVNDVHIPIAGQCRGPLKIRPLTPNASWNKDKQTVVLKSFQASDGIEARFLVTVLGLDEGQVLEFTKVDGPENVTITLTHQARAIYWLDLKVAPGAQTLISPNDPLRFKISTSHSQLPEWALELVYRSL